MSDIGVSYDIHYNPNPVTVDVDVQLNGTTVSISLADVPAMLVTASPSYSANIGSDILSTLGTPLVNLITAGAGAFAAQILQNRSFNIYTVPPLSFSLSGAAVQLQPAGLKLASLNGMLMLTGDLSIQ